MEKHAIKIIAARSAKIIADMIPAKPFVKWCGGKRAIADKIIDLMPERFNRYWEPFIGGGGLFFKLAEKGVKKASISDLNPELMIAYGAIRKNVHEVIEELRVHVLAHNQHGEKHFLKVRQQIRLKKAARVAARLIYLNRTCYNGLYRVNQSGKFNVPFGKYSNPKILDEENLLAVSKVLQRTKVLYQSFEKITPGKGDFVYCDPPYEEKYQGYTPDRFGAERQQALHDEANRWRDSGIHVILSNSDTEQIREIYRDWTIHEIKAPRAVSCKADGRGSVTELLMTP